MTIPNDLLITIWKEEVVPWLLRPWQRLKIIIFKSLNRLSNRTWLAGLDSHNLRLWYKNSLGVIYWVTWYLPETNDLFWPAPYIHKSKKRAAMLPSHCPSKKIYDIFLSDPHPWYMILNLMVRLISCELFHAKLKG